jgi:23S rRNA (cytidine1920-2'-O)/16S rRNA (cytidine1409-2'-O)-methyltransferase
LSKPNRPRFVALTQLLAARHPGAAADAIALGHVVVDGRVITNPNARVRHDASIRLAPGRRLRGDIKLSYCLDTLGIPVSGRVAVDLGASAGGFTTALLERGARRVYAVDAGVGQLVGRLRVDPRVVNLEGCNLGDLTPATLDRTIDIVVMDLSYLPLADALPQLEWLPLEHGADMVLLVKPTFELRRGRMAASDDDLRAAFASAHAAVARSGWFVVGTADAPRTGRRGSREFFVHARRNRV